MIMALTYTSNILGNSNNSEVVEVQVRGISNTVARRVVWSEACK
jgi:hypothetical protein